MSTINKYKKPLPKKSAYMYGKPITNLKELDGQEFIVVNGKVYHRGWWMSWAIKDIIRLFNKGMVFQVIKKSERQKIPDFGDIQTREDFEEMVKDGFFTDYDGYGYYSDGEYEYHMIETLTEPLEEGWTHIIWYNK